MPAFLLSAVGALQPAWSLLKRFWPYVVVVVLVVLAGIAVHHAGVRAAERDAALEKATAEATRAKADADAERQRQVVARQIADATALARQDAAVDAETTRQREAQDNTRQKRDAVAIASAKQDPMVSDGGPLDMLFSGDDK